MANVQNPMQECSKEDSFEITCICCTLDDFQILNCSSTILYKGLPFLPCKFYFPECFHFLLHLMSLYLFKGLYDSLWVQIVQFSENK